MSPTYGHRSGRRHIAALHEQHPELRALKAMLARLLIGRAVVPRVGGVHRGNTLGVAQRCADAALCLNARTFGCLRLFGHRETKRLFQQTGFDPFGQLSGGWRLIVVTAVQHIAKVGHGQA